MGIEEIKQKAYIDRYVKIASQLCEWVNAKPDNITLREMLKSIKVIDDYVQHLEQEKQILMEILKNNNNGNTK